MGLPTMPNSGNGGQRKRPAPKARPARGSSGQGNSLPALPDLDSSMKRKSPPSKSARPVGAKESQRAQNSRRQTKPKSQASRGQRPDAKGYLTDPKTGKKYKPLSARDPELVKAFRQSKGAITLDQLMRYNEDVEGFDIDDLNSTADTFLAHLRVPPSKEEQAALLAEKARQKKIQNENRVKYLESLGPEEDEYEDNEY